MLGDRNKEPALVEIGRRDEAAKIIIFGPSSTHRGKKLPLQCDHPSASSGPMRVQQ